MVTCMGRLKTTDLLSICGIIEGIEVCCFCRVDSEPPDNILLSCFKALADLKRLLKMVGVLSVTHQGKIGVEWVE